MKTTWKTKKYERVETALPVASLGVYLDELRTEGLSWDDVAARLRTETQAAGAYEYVSHETSRSWWKGWMHWEGPSDGAS